MKRTLIIFLTLILLLLSACTESASGDPTDTTDSIHKLTKDDFYYYERIEHVGETPSGFAHIVEQNLFDATFAAHGKVVKLEREADHYPITVYDYYGNLLGSFEIKYEEHYLEPDIYPTSDGNLLAVCALSGYYDTENQSWTVEEGKASRVTKLDVNGNILFETEIEDCTDQDLNSFIETDGYYILAGDSTVTSEDGTKIVNVSVVKLSLDGEVIAKRRIENGSYSILRYAEAVDGKIRLHTRAHTFEDGIYVRNYYVFDLDVDLNIISKTHADESEYSDKSFGYYGIVDGEPVHYIHDLIPDFDAGSIRTVIDYGDSVLVISNRLYASEIRGEKSNPLSHYETVYSCYTKDGRLIWRNASAYPG